MKKILLSIAIVISALAEGQVTSVSLQASGLTCSMCSNSINKALGTLEFVLKVEADIKTYTFRISFKPNSIIDFDMIRQKVENAGFTVSAFIATTHFENVQVKNNEPVKVQNKTFLFINSKDQVLNGHRQVRVLDKGFIPAKAYKKETIAVSSQHTYHVTLN